MFHKGWTKGRKKTSKLKGRKHIKNKYELFLCSWTSSYFFKKKCVAICVLFVMFKFSHPFFNRPSYSTTKQQQQAKKHIKRQQAKKGNKGKKLWNKIKWKIITKFLFQLSSLPEHPNTTNHLSNILLLVFTNWM